VQEEQRYARNVLLFHHEIRLAESLGETAALKGEKMMKAMRKLEKVLVLGLPQEDDVFAKVNTHGSRAV